MTRARGSSAKPTAGRFTSRTLLGLEPGWSIAYAPANAYRINDPHDYLGHAELPVDEPVWLQPHDVANGRDTVVAAAVNWITSQTP